MNLVNEIYRLHDLTELAQKLRPEVEHEIGGGAENGPMSEAHHRLTAMIVEACRAVCAKVDA